MRDALPGLAAGCSIFHALLAAGSGFQREEHHHHMLFHIQSTGTQINTPAQLNFLSHHRRLIHVDMLTVLPI